MNIRVCFASLLQQCWWNRTFGTSAFVCFCTCLSWCWFQLNFHLSQCFYYPFTYLLSRLNLFSFLDSDLKSWFRSVSVILKILGLSSCWNFFFFWAINRQLIDLMKTLFSADCTLCLICLTRFQKDHWCCSLNLLPMPWV